MPIPSGQVAKYFGVYSGKIKERVKEYSEKEAFWKNIELIITFFTISFWLNKYRGGNTHLRARLLIKFVCTNFNAEFNSSCLFAFSRAFLSFTLKNNI